MKNLKIQSEQPALDVQNLGEMIGRAKHELEHMVDMNPRIMLLIGTDGRVVRTNRALLELLGKRSFHEIIGMSVFDLFDCGDTRFLPRLIDRPNGMGEGDAAVTLPNRGVHMLHFCIVMGGSTDLRVLLVEDVTAYRDDENRLRREYRKEAIRELVGALMHTINQHLTVIGVRASLLTMAMEKGVVDPDEFRKGLEDISSLTLKIADTLSRVGQPQDFETIPYLNGERIMDLNRPIAEQ